MYIVVGSKVGARITKIVKNMVVFFCPSSNFFIFQYFFMKFFVQSDLILKRSFPRSFDNSIFLVPLKCILKNAVDEKILPKYDFYKTISQTEF